MMYAFVLYAFIFVHCIVFYSSGMEARIYNNCVNFHTNVIPVYLKKRVIVISNNIENICSYCLVIIRCVQINVW